MRTVLVLAGAAAAGYFVTILVLPLMGLAGDPGPPFTGAIIYAVAAALVLAIVRSRRRRSDGHG